MFHSQENIPTTYAPYEELVLCSNRFIRGQIPIQINLYPILLIGKGETPKVWISAPLNDKATQWRYVVEESKPLTPQLSLETPNIHSLIIRAGEITMLKVDQTSQAKAQVTSLDLRPIGLNIYGDSSALHVSGHTLAENTFTDVVIMISLGKEK